MAKLNYLITGISGTGKSTICQRLQTEGHHAVDADDAFSAQVGPQWLWDEAKLDQILRDQIESSTFVCGSATNQRDFIRRFDKAFVLYVDDATLTKRLTSRTGNDYGKQPHELQQMLEYNHQLTHVDDIGNKTFIDATRPLDVVVSNILSLCDIPGQINV